MKWKAKLAAAALSVVVAAPASAAIQLPASGNGEVVFTLWDPITQTSYTRDLGITLNNFFGSPTTGRSFAADSTLTSFLGGLDAASRSALQWNVVNTGDTVVFGNPTTNPQTGMTPTGVIGSGYRFLMTASTAVQALFNNQLPNLATTVYFVNVNTQRCLNGGSVAGCTTDFAANGSLATSALENASAYGGSFGSFWNGRLSFNTSAGVGQSMSFWSMVTSSNTGTQRAAMHQFANGSTPTQWTFNTDGSLVYAPVPEPSTYALMLAGLLAIGAVARRRMK